MHKRSRSLSRFALLLLTVVILAPSISFSAPVELVLQYGSRGLQQLSYKGQVLEDIAAYPADAFHIGHMKAQDLTGNILKADQDSWGENNNGRHWDAGAKTWTYFFNWGEISLQYVQNGNTLDLLVTETNSSTSEIIFDGAAIYPLALHLPQTPADFGNQSYSHYAFNTTGPSVTFADYGSGEVAAVVKDASKPLYSGFQAAGTANTYLALVSSTTPDGLATFMPHNDRPVAPGHSDTFTISLRFAPPETPQATLAGDIYRNWASTWPAKLNWADRRVIGTVYLARSARGPVGLPAGYTNNPRRYFGDSNSDDFDVASAEGLKHFQARILQQSASIVQNLRRLNAQGAITWDVEGQQYPQSTSYVCSPDQIGTVAPEMESIITDSNSPYAGMHLVDAYFKIISSAGFRIGVCVRPQHFTIAADKSAQQVSLPNSAAISDEIIHKMRYAHDRWGATLFYVDSTVEPTGAVLDASIFERAAAAFPDALLIPEETTPRHYAYTAPFKSFLFHGELGTDPTVRDYYPKAFSVNLINDVDASTLAVNQTALTTAVRHGDVLMALATFWHPNDDTILDIYKNAGGSADPDEDASALPMADFQGSDRSSKRSFSPITNLLGQTALRLRPVLSESLPRQR